MTKKQTTKRRTRKPKPPAEEPQGVAASESGDTTLVPPLFGSTETKAPPPKIKVPADGTLIRKDGDPVVFVMSNGEKRPLRDANVFAACGFGWNEIVVLSPEEIDRIPAGEVVARQGDLQGKGA